MAEERIDIVVSQKGATEVKRDLEGLGQGARQSSPAVQALKDAIAAVSSVSDKLRASLGGASAPVRELKRLVDDLTRSMASVAGTNFTAQISAPLPSMGSLSAAAIRAAGGVRVLGDSFMILGGNASTAIVPLGALSTSVVALSTSLSTASVASGSTAVAVLSASTAVSTMTISIAELSRRIVALGYLLAALRGQFGNLQISNSTRLLTDFAARARDITPAIQPASQALLTFQGATQSSGSVLGGFFTGALQRLQGLWGGFTNGVRGAWTAMTGFLGSLGGGGGNINNVGNGIAAAGNAAGGAVPKVNALTTSFFGLWRILLALAIIRQVGTAIASSIDSYIQMSNRLRQVSTDNDNLVASQNAVYESAQRTRSGMDEIATLYTRTAKASEELGLSQREVMNITETVAMAMKLNGGSVQESANAMRQLSQAFNKGKLDGDEFRSIMENAPALQRAFTEGLKVSKAELYAMSKAGELTLPKLIGALQTAGPAIRAAFEGTLPTLAEGFQYLGNSVTQFLGKLNEATGFSQGFYNVMKFLGDNLGVIGVALAFVGTAILITFGPAAITAVVSFGAALGLATGGLSLIIPLLAAVAAAIYTWGDAWKVTADGITVLDYIRAALQITGEYVGIVVGYISSAFGTAWTFVSEKWGQLTGFFGEQSGNVGTIIQTAVAGYIGLWIGFYRAIIAAFEELPGALVGIFQLAMNGSIQVVQDGLNGILGAINGVLERLSIPLIPTVDLSGWKTEIESGAFDVGDKVGAAFSQGMQDGKDATQALVDAAGNAITNLTNRAREISEARRAAEANQPQLSTVPGANTYTPPVDSGAAKEAEKLEKRLSSLLKTLDPLIGAQEKLKQGTDTLNEAYAAGLITMERRDELLKRLNEHLRDQLDPLGAINREMEKEAGLLRLGNQEREVQKQLLDDIEKLRKAGVTLSPIEAQQLEASIRAMEQLKEQSKLLGDVLDRVFKGAEDAFIQFIETGKVDFSSLVTSMISDIARLAFQSFVTKPLTNILGNLLGSFLPGAGSLFGQAGGFPAAPTGGLYATGGSFVVGGSGGVDSQKVQFRASPGERVTIDRAGSSNGGNMPSQVVFNIQTPDVKGFKASESQIAARMQRLASRGNRNM